MKKYLTVLLTILAPIAVRAAYPSTDPVLAAGTIAGFSSVYDYQTSNYHCAYIDMAGGKVVYKYLSPDGTVLATTVAGEVATTQETAEAYAKTSIDFDSASRPVIAYTRFQSNSRSIRIARWNGSAWVDGQVRQGVTSNRLSLALRNRDASLWRLAYVHFTEPSLRLASASGDDIKVIDLDHPHDNPGFHLRYSANSGSVVFRDPADSALKFANLLDNGTSPVIGNTFYVDASGNAGAQVYAQPGPGGWPNFVYRDENSGAIKRARRLPDYSWVHETVIRPTSGTLANPTLAFDEHGTPMVACTDTAGDRIRFAALVGGQWYEDQINTADFYSRPLFLSPQPEGGFRLFAVGQFSSSPAMHLRQFGPIDDFVDADADGVPLRFERAFMMNPHVPDRSKLPIVNLRNIGGQRRLVLTMRQAPGGTANGGATYQTDDHLLTIQASKDLRTWISNPSLILLSDSFTVSGVRYSESYLADPVGTADGYRFMRVDVERR